VTIALSPETADRLRRKAERDHSSIDAAAESLLAAALEAEERDRAEAIAGVRRGDEAVAEGRERLLSEFLAASRRKGFVHGHVATMDDDGLLAPVPSEPDEQITRS
jgi:predicted transcriptional regulator